MSSNDDPGVWALNNRSAVAIGYWMGPSSYTGPAEFRINDRNPEYFQWDRRLEISHHEERNGHTIYLPHYMLLMGWAVLFGLLLLLRHWRYRNIRMKRARMSDEDEES